MNAWLEVRWSEVVDGKAESHAMRVHDVQFSEKHIILIRFHENVKYISTDTLVELHIKPTI